MACGSCSSGQCSTGGGCSGGCSSGGCNKMNTFDWLAQLDIEDEPESRFVEISFSNGTNKEFFINEATTRCVVGDMVLVESKSGGFDIGRINLGGDLARLQMTKKKVKPNAVLLKVIRKANERDLERMLEAKSREKESMIKARAISRTLGLTMKVFLVEYQADGRKATFYYTAEGRIDFRELIREYGREFKVKVDMRQIAPRQETAILGGIGSCGRELCCSTWLNDLKSVDAAAARYQNLAINQAKLSGQCGRLKCCLNYELDTYLDALESFPEKPEKIQTKAGTAEMIKMDVFKGIMTYCYYNGPEKGSFFTLDKETVRKLKDAAKAGEPFESLRGHQIVVNNTRSEFEPEHDYEDVTGAVELQESRRKKKKKPISKMKFGPQAPSGGAPGGRPPRPERPQGGPQQQRPPRPERPQGPVLPQQRPPRPDGPPQQQRPPRPDGPPQQQRPPRPDGPPQQQRPPRPDGPPQLQRPPRPDGPPQQQRPPRPDGPPQQQRPPRPERPQRPPHDGGVPPESGGFQRKPKPKRPFNPNNPNLPPEGGGGDSGS
jgi:cell fate regulator YaaT (PSP1 superfamily)